MLELRLSPAELPSAEEASDGDEDAERGEEEEAPLDDSPPFDVVLGEGLVVGLLSGMAPSSSWRGRVFWGVGREKEGMSRARPSLQHGKNKL